MDNSVSRRTTTSDETRQRLLRAAAELIAEVGWGRVTTRAVATRAGLPHGTVSYHFHGKQELLTDAALDTFARAFPVDQLHTLATLPDLVSLLEPWISEPGDADPVVSRVGIEAMLESERNPLLRERLRALLREFRQTLTDLARAAQASGNAPPGVPPDAIATLIGAIGDGLFLHARLDPDLDTTAALGALRKLLSR